MCHNLIPRHLKKPPGNEDKSGVVLNMQCGFYLGLPGLKLLMSLVSFWIYTTFMSVSFSSSCSRNSFTISLCAASSLWTSSNAREMREERGGEEERKRKGRRRGREKGGGEEEKREEEGKRKGRRRGREREEEGNRERRIGGKGEMEEER